MSGEVVGRGRFRVDRRRALDKMERFQLEDPYRYVLEVLAAARCAGTDRVEVYNDSDDFVASWSGDAPTRDELEALFDHLFGGGDDAHARMLQHLALGAIGGLALKPRWLRIDRAGDDGAHRVDVTDPTETTSEPVEGATADGVRFDLREQFGQATLAEALVLLVQPPVETRLIRGAARWFPVPIEVNGAALPRAEAPAAHWAEVTIDAHGRTGHLWLVDETPHQRIDVLRHGIVVAGRTHLVPGDRRYAPASYDVVGWIDDPNLRLNASRSAVVQDDAWQQLRAAIDDAVCQLLARIGDVPPPMGLVRAAIHELQHHGRPATPLAGLPCADDLRGKVYTFAELCTCAPPPGWTAAPDAFHAADPPYVVLASHYGPWLEQNVKGCLGDVGRDLAKRAEGRKREAAAVPGVPRLSGTARSLDDGTVRGAIRLVSLCGPAQSAGTLVLLVRGRVVEQTSFPAIGGTFEAIATDTELDADPSFTSVDRTSAAWTRITRAVAKGVTRELTEAALAGVPRADLALGGMITAVAGEISGEAFAERVRSTLPNDVFDAKVLPTGAGTTVSLRDVLERKDWYVVTTVPASAPTALGARMLVPSAEFRASWQRWLRARTQEDANVDAERERRLGLPRREAVLGDSAGRDRVRIADQHLTGEICITSGGSPGALEVVRQGVHVETLSTRPAPYDGVFSGVIDIGNGAVSPAHDRLPPGEAERLLRALQPSVTVLVHQYWQRLGAVAFTRDPRILTWLDASGLAATRSPPLGPMHAAKLRDGRAVTFDELSKLFSSHDPALVISEVPPADLPLRGAVIATTPLHAQVLRQWLGDAGIDGRPRVSQIRDAYQTYLRQPRASVPDSFARRPLKGDGYEGVCLLPTDPQRAGLQHVEAHWMNRLLGARVPGTPGAFIAVWGSAIEPNDLFNGPRDADVLRSIGAHAARQFDELVDEALAAIEGDEPGRHRDAWLAIASRVKAKQLSEKGNRRLRQLKLIRRIDGSFVSIAEIADATREGASPRRVPPSRPSGSAPHPWYLYEPQGIELTALFGKLPDGSVELDEHAEAQRKLGSAPRRRAEVAYDALAKRALDIADHDGEIGLLATGKGIVIEPLHAGIALAPITENFPVPLRVVITGKSITPDRSLSTLVVTPAWEGVVKVVRAIAHELVRDTLLAWCKQDQGGPLALHAEAYAFSIEGRALALLPLASGERVSRDELDARKIADGVIGFVTSGGQRFVTGPTPVLARYDDTLSRMRNRFGNVVNLDPIAERHRRPGHAPPHGTWSVRPAGREGQVGLAPGRTSEVSVQCRGIHLANVAYTELVPLQGWISAPDFAPDPTWTGLSPATARLVDAALAEASRAVVTTMLASNTSGQLDGPLRYALLALCPDAATLKAAVTSTGPSTLASRLASAPLFCDTRGSRTSLVRLCEEQAVYALTGVPDSAPPTSKRYFALTSEERSRLASVVAIRDGDAALAVERKAAERRAAHRFVRRAPPAGTAAVSGAGLDGTLWLSSDAQDVAVVVGGSRVMALELGVVGLRGWIEGDLPTDEAFTRAHLSDAQLDRVEATVKGLLAAEARTSPEKTRARIIPTRGRIPEVFDDLALYVDHAGGPLTVRAILDRMAQKEPVPVALGEPAQIAQFKQLFPKARIAHDTPGAAPAASKSAEDRARRDIVAIARRLVPDADAKQLRATIDALPAPATPVACVIAAWEAATRIAPLRSTDAEMALLLRVAHELKRALADSG